MLMSRFRPFIPRYYDLPLFTIKLKLNSVFQSEDQPIHNYTCTKTTSWLPASSTTMAGDKQSAIRTLFIIMQIYHVTTFVLLHCC
jgi:hypothetical protein